MDTRALTVFLSVAETLNFSRSAEKLHMSVSAVSRAIARLEEEVGQPLLERDRRSVRLSPAGREFHDFARRSLAQWQALQRKLGSEGELAGEVSLYCSVTASHTLLAPILAAFRHEYAAVDIMMHTGDQADGVNRVLSGQDDVAVTIKPLHSPSRLEFLPLVESPLQFFMPAANCQVRDRVLEARDGPLDWGVLPLIVPERGTTKELFDDWIRDQRIRPRIYAQVAGHEAIVAMVSLGLGVGIAPQLVIESSGLRDQVEVFEVDAALPSLSIGLASLRQRLASPLLGALWRVAGQTYPGSSDTIAALTQGYDQ
ncbi:transcriptional regulator IlvY [Halioglobus sp. HI00S01]|uniref:HTH-type transcriptional activator IlvY n=1 Tax=Halioglobus sp. HI00S01 TaxID=1822214 RepID=UPI0007C35174|nr:HTH-type transcriptional activator IlvY [Halioglobus sp. HI00S01]KZX58622.1 transcriptional regulator IlvY [Halioglobus sp. HI00S01]